MYEKRTQPLAPMSTFIFRMVKSICLATLIVGTAVFIGTLGYHYFEGLEWIDAFLNASMILSSMGQVAPLQTTGGKLFAAFYALFSGLVFIVIVSIIIAPVIHRVTHSLHLS